MSGYTTFKNLRVTGDFDADHSFDASALPVTATGSTTARTLATRFSEVKNLKDFGAVGDGSTNDTTAIAAWAAALNLSGGIGFVPPGTYVSTARVLFTDKPVCIMGSGVGASIFLFTSATSAAKGLRWAPTGSGTTLNGFACRDLTIRTSTIGGIAIDCANPDDGVFSNDSRVFIDRIEITGAGSGYFDLGVSLYNCGSSTVQNVKYWGSALAPTASAGYYAGTGFKLTTQLAADDPALGLSLENRFIACTVNFAAMGLDVSGFCEAVYVTHSNFAFVKWGIQAAAPTGTKQPWVFIEGNHINATDFCVYLNGFSQAHIGGNHLSRPDTTGNAAYNGGVWQGVLLDGSDDTTVSNNRFLAESADAALSALYAVRVLNSYRAGISDNRFVGAAAKNMSAGVLLEATAQGCKVSGGNQYALVTTPIGDFGVSSDTSLLERAAVTVQVNGSTVSTASQASLLNFSGPLIGSGSLTTVTVAVDPSVIGISGGNITFSSYTTGSAILGTASNKVGFFGSTGTTKTTVTGSIAGNAALASLVAALTNMGLIDNSTTI